MKKQMNKLVLFLIPAMLLLSCSEDKYSEKDALDAQQTIDLLITVVDASSVNAPVSEAKVSIVLNDELVEQTTNDVGVTIFTKVSIGGDVAVSVSKDTYTSVFRTVNTTPDSYRQKQVSAVVYVYSKDATKMATFRGRLTYEGDLTNRKREVAAGVVVKARNSYLSNSTEQLFTDTTDADGKYELLVPVTSNSNEIQLYYPDLVVNQNLAFEQPDKSIAVAERSVLYKFNQSAGFDIPSFPSAYATVAAPTATSAGSGFTLGAKANRVALSFIGSYYYLIDGGAGYNGGVTVSDYEIPFTADEDDNVAMLQVDIVDGIITNIDGINDYGATYDAAPSLNHSALATQPTTQATITLYFRTSYNLYISSRGSGYVNYPTVSAEADNYSGYTKIRQVDPDINDWSTTFLGDGEILNDHTDIVGGVIKSNTGNGDTLIVTDYLASAPTFSVIEPSIQKATLYIDPSYIDDTDSTLTYIDIDDSGFGYDPANPPAVTVTSLGGWGSGAVAKATVSASTWLNAIYIPNQGKKYVQNINDYRNQGVTWDTHDDPSFADYPYDYYGYVPFYSVKSGDINVQDVYYGTGFQIINQDQAKK